MSEAPDPVTQLTQRDARELTLQQQRASLDRKRSRASVAVGPDSPTSAFKQIKGLFDQYAPLGHMLPWDALDYVELLATYNPDFSQAVENIRTLANSGHELFVTGKNQRTTDELKNYLEGRARKIQERHGGIDGLIDKLLEQAATFGAMCGEWILSEDLTEVVDFADVNPKTIRFFWGEPEQRWIPFQKVSAAQVEQAKRSGQEVRNQCVRLNEATFRYYAFNAAPNSPYGTPPFVAALSNIAIQRDMVHNMSQIVKKIGLLGIIDLIIESLPPRPDESETDYAARAGAYLDEYAKVVEEMVRDGGIVHFDDVEVKTTNLAGNAAGATNIFKQNEEQVFSGLKSMPSVQGRSYSTTETYAGVAYDIIIRNTHRYQKGAKRMIESGYWLMSTLQGASPTKISLAFNPNKTLQRLHDAQAHQIEIRNMLLKWALGIIDQHQGAQELGYTEVATEHDEPPTSAAGGTPDTSAGTSGGATNNTANFIMSELHAALSEQIPAVVPDNQNKVRHDKEEADE